MLIIVKYVINNYRYTYTIHVLNIIIYDYVRHDYNWKYN